MDRRHIPLTNTLEAFTVMGSFSYAAYSTAKAVMVALFYCCFFGLGFDFRQNPRILAVIAIHAERENHCILYRDTHLSLPVKVMKRGRILLSLVLIP